MRKRRLSTFDRLNRRERRQLGRRLYSPNPGLTIVHPNAAGIDVGNESHFVAVPPDRDERPQGDHHHGPGRLASEGRQGAGRVPVGRDDDLGQVPKDGVEAGTLLGQRPVQPGRAPAASSRPR